MQVFKSAAGVRSLKGIAATASSARILDLHALAAETPDDPDYLESPLFAHPMLNRSIIVKHNIGADEDDRFGPGRFNATKIIFPFDQSDLDLGGQFLIVDQRDFVGALTRHLDYTALPLERDLAVLRAMDRLPTLDPFLVREILHQQQIEVGLCYYRFSQCDKAQMLDFVAGEIEALIRACVGELQTNDKRTRHMSQLLLADQGSPELEPLRATFRMEPAEFTEAMFSWKAFLYYRWRSRTLGPLLRANLRSISGIQSRRYDHDELSFIDRAKRLLEKTVTSSWRDVEQRLRLYDRAFASLTDQESADAFRLFLINGHNLFLQLGDRIGRLEQVSSFWTDRFGGGRVSELSPDEVFDGLRDLLQALSVRIADPSAQVYGPEARSA